MRTIKLTTGAALTLDGDLLTVLEALYKEISANHELQSTFEDMAREIQHIIGQMTDEERRHYLSESLFLNVVSYENERLGAYVKKLTERVGFQTIGLSPELSRDPVHLLLAVEHDGDALRRPAGLRLRRSVRQARARRHADGGVGRRGLDRATRRPACAGTSSPAARSSAATARSSCR